jgi:hypothetical protein
MVNPAKPRLIRDKDAGSGTVLAVIVTGAVYPPFNSNGPAEVLRDETPQLEMLAASAVIGPIDVVRPYDENAGASKWLRS